MRTRKAYVRRGLAASALGCTVLLASEAGVTPWTVMDVAQSLSARLVTERTVLRSETSKKVYNERAAAFEQVASEVPATE